MEAMESKAFIISHSWVGKIELGLKDYDYQNRLTLFEEGCDGDQDDPYRPATSITIFGEKAMRDLHAQLEEFIEAIEENKSS